MYKITVRVSALIVLASVFAAAHVMQHHVEYKPVTAEQLTRLHGHMGPYVVIGAKMGEFAVEKYGMPRYFGVTVEVECPASPPFTCIIDGLQMATGATMGKRNIHLKDGEGMRVIIRDDESGKWLDFTLTDEARTMLAEWEKTRMDVEERGARCFEMEPDHLFKAVIHE
ncbi:MAG: hypothetical protein GC154_16495 [bacterium]|nr:hypothetical protein [bacterium]